MRSKVFAASLILGFSILAIAPLSAAPLTSEITYQGRLLDNGGMASGTFDFQYQLWNDASAGTQVGSTITKTNVTVSGGLFTEKLDFGSTPYDGQALWLQIRVKKTSEGAYTPLTPRTALNAGPYSLSASIASTVVDGAITRPKFAAGMRNTLDASDGTPTNAVFTDSAGRVGIGTTTPQTFLDVVNAVCFRNKVSIGTTLAATSQLWVNSAAERAVQIDSTDADGTWIDLNNTSSGGAPWSLISTGASNGQGAGHFIIAASAVTKLFVDNNGNVGIGTGLTAPAAKLHVVDTGSQSLQVDSSNTTGTWSRIRNTSAGGHDWATVATGSGSAEGVGKLLFRDVTSSTNSMMMESDGDVQMVNKVGIGATPPSSVRLYINDTGTQSLQVDGSNTIGTWSRFRNTTVGGTDWAMVSTGSGNGEGAGKLLFHNVTSTTNSMMMESDGDVQMVNKLGIGGTSTGPKLHIFDSGTQSLQVDGSNTIGTWSRFRNTTAGGKDWAIVSTGSGNGEGAGKLLFRNVTDSKSSICLQADGDVEVPVLEITGGADIAEPFDIAGDKPQPGMVVCIDPENPGGLRVATNAYDRTVAGIISGAGGVNPGMMLKHEGTVADGDLPVALTGRVYCYVDADAAGPVAVGDMLTTSSTPGHAMRVTEFDRAHGAVIGKAMTELKSGKGLVLVLVNLQ